MSGRGVSQMGRGHPVPTRQSQRSADVPGATVSIQGLSTSTTELQLKNLLRSIGPIEVGAKYVARNGTIGIFFDDETSFHLAKITN